MSDRSPLLGDVSPGCTLVNRPALDVGRVAKAVREEMEVVKYPATDERPTFYRVVRPEETVYTVSLEPAMTCTCPDVVHRDDTVCKHLVRVLILEGDPEACRLALYVGCRDGEGEHFRECLEALVEVEPTLALRALVRAEEEQWAVLEPADLEALIEGYGARFQRWALGRLREAHGVEGQERVEGEARAGRGR